MHGQNQDLSANLDFKSEIREKYHFFKLKTYPVLMTVWINLSHRKRYGYAAWSQMYI